MIVSILQLYLFWLAASIWNKSFNEEHFLKFFSTISSKCDPTKLQILSPVRFTDKNGARLFDEREDRKTVDGMDLMKCPKADHSFPNKHPLTKTFLSTLIDFVSCLTLNEHTNLWMVRHCVTQIRCAVSMPFLWANYSHFIRFFKVFYSLQFWGNLFNPKSTENSKIMQFPL